MDLKREWTEGYGSVDPEEEEIEWTERRLLVIPGCCKESETLMTVALQLGSADIYDNEVGQENCKPEWEVIKSYEDYLNPRRHKFHRLVVKYCPHCGTKMPPIRRRKEPISPICEVVDGGYYCNTCDERLHGCKCWPCEAHWEVDE